MICSRCSKSHRAVIEARAHAVEMSRIEAATIATIALRVSVPVPTFNLIGPSAPR
jgi:hypothetical protein